MIIATILGWSGCGLFFIGAIIALIGDGGLMIASNYTPGKLSRWGLFIFLIGMALIFIAFMLSVGIPQEVKDVG